MVRRYHHDARLSIAESRAAAQDAEGPDQAMRETHTHGSLWAVVGGGEGWLTDGRRSTAPPR